jgi:hypothetical protein
MLKFLIICSTPYLAIMVYLDEEDLVMIAMVNAVAAVVDAMGFQAHPLDGYGGHHKAYENMFNSP